MGDVTYPVRIQLSRKKGFNLQAASMALNGLPAVTTARPGTWGNPWRAVNEHYFGNGWVVLDPDWIPQPRRFYCSSRRVAMRLAVWKYRRWLNFHPARRGMDALAGCNLACWCKPGDPCHADVLLELANIERLSHG